MGEIRSRRICPYMHAYIGTHQWARSVYLCGRRRGTRIMRTYHARAQAHAGVFPIAHAHERVI